MSPCVSADAPDGGGELHTKSSVIPRLETVPGSAGLALLRQPIVAEFAWPARMQALGRNAGDVPAQALTLASTVECAGTLRDTPRRADRLRGPGSIPRRIRHVARGDAGRRRDTAAKRGAGADVDFRRFPTPPGGIVARRVYRCRHRADGNIIDVAAHVRGWWMRCGHAPRV